MKKRILSLALALLMILSLMPTMALADGEVAQIGENKYPTFEAALAAVTDEETIVLLQDVAENCHFKVTGGKTVTLDLAGHSVKSTAVGAWATIRADGSVLIVIDSVGGGTVKKAEFSFDGGVNTEYGYALMAEGGTVTVRSGSVESIWNWTDDDSARDDCVTNIEGGTVGTVSMDFGETNVTGGKVDEILFFETSYGLALDADLTVTGGEVGKISVPNTTNDPTGVDIKITAGVIGMLDLSDKAATGNGETVYISGGSFSEAVPESYCKEGFSASVKNEDGSYGDPLPKQEDDPTDDPTGDDTGLTGFFQKLFNYILMDKYYENMKVAGIFGIILSGIQVMMNFFGNYFA